MFFIFTPPHNIHGWKATDLSLVLAPSDRNLKHPTSRQNFGDEPGQTPKLILTLCLIHSWSIGLNFDEVNLSQSHVVVRFSSVYTVHLI